MNASRKSFNVATLGQSRHQGHDRAGRGDEVRGPLLRDRVSNLNFDVHIAHLFGEFLKLGFGKRPTACRKFSNILGVLIGRHPHPDLLPTFADAIGALAFDPVACGTVNQWSFRNVVTPYSRT